MARTTIQDVRNVLPSDGGNLTDPQIQQAIDTATLLVDQIATGCGSHLPDDILKQIETYTAAHLVAVSHPDQVGTSVLVEEKFENSSKKYSTGSFNNFLGTTYGTTANLLSNGCLMELNQKPARIYSLGSI